MLLLKRLVRASLVLCAVVVLACAWWLFRPLKLDQASIALEVERGSSPKAVAKAWVDAGVSTQPRLLYGWFRLSGQATKIRAGSYAIDAGISPWGLLALMVRGEQSYASVRLGEGWSMAQIRQALAQTEGLTPAGRDLSDAELMAALGIDPQRAEGAFFPDTYYFSKGTKDLDVLQRAGTLMERRLQRAWEGRDARLPLNSPLALLTLASMVEKESGLAADLPMVAAVFVNRLRLGMPLQSDPTVIYAMGAAYAGRLQHEDLLRDGPYNTYTHVGLPPTPIASVSWLALQAASHPAPSAALYFVARGDGSSQFSETLSQHNEAVKRYLKHRGEP